MTSRTHRSITYTRQTPRAGTGVFAANDIGPGELIFRVDRPLVSALDSPHLKDTCYSCYLWVPENQSEDEGEYDGVGMPKLKACTGCRIVRYCGQDCQSQSWKSQHKYECKIFKNLHPRVLPNTVRVAIQLLLRRKAKSLPDNEWQEFLDLQSHIDEFKAQQTRNDENLTIWQTIELMSQAILSYSRINEPLDIIQGIVARTLINGLTHVTPTYQPLGLCLSPTAAHLNHSCEPNAVIVFSGPSLSVRSLAPIQKDYEIFISYIDITTTTPIRQDDLQSRFFFTCTCKSCMNNITCSLPDTPPPLLSRLPGPKLAGLDAEATDLLMKAKSSSPTDAVQLLEKAMTLFTPHKSVYPLHRQPWASIRHQTMLVNITLQNWSLALTHALKAYFYVDPVHCPQTWHPVRIVRKWVVFRLVSQLANLQSAGQVKELDKHRIDWAVVGWGLLKEVRNGAQKSHGEDNLFVKDVEQMYAQDIWRELEKNAGMEVLETEWGKMRTMADEAD